MLPTIRIGDVELTRLIIGGNPFSGNSHVDAALSREMIDYFSTANIKRALFRCMEVGINAMQLRADTHIMRMINEFRQEGGNLRWIAQTASENRSFEGNVNQTLQYSPDAIYHHGTLTDALWKSGEIGELKRRLAVLRATGKPVGLCTHMPEVIARAEEEAWDIDFYMACVYNLSRQDRVSSAITGKANTGECFDDSDIPVMYRTIRAASKPCLAFKILGATRRCDDQRQVAGAFDEAFANIKQSDAVVVGMFPKYLDQPALNAEYTLRAIEKAIK